MFVCTSRELWHAVRPSSRRSHSGGGQALRCRGPVCVQHVHPGDRWHQVRHGTGYSHFQFVMHWLSYSYTPRPPSHSIIVTSSLRAVYSHLSSSLPSPALPSFWGGNYLLLTMEKKNTLPLTFPVLLLLLLPLGGIPGQPFKEYPSYHWINGIIPR